MPHSKTNQTPEKTGQTPESHASGARSAADGESIRAFGLLLAKDDFAGAAKFIQPIQAEETLRPHLADFLMVEIETRLEAGKLPSAKKCLEMLMKLAPERIDEASMWFADYHMGELSDILSTSGIASYGKELANVLFYAPQRKPEAHQLIAQYYMSKLKKLINENRGGPVEIKALSELLRYGPSRKAEAYHLFAERAMEEMREALSDHDKEYAKMALENFLKFAPHREEEANQVWEQHMEMSRQRKLYDILGLERTATAEEIKRTYYTLAKKLHPDVNSHNPSAEEQMRHVNAAYSI